MGGKGSGSGGGSRGAGDWRRTLGRGRGANDTGREGAANDTTPSREAARMAVGAEPFQHLLGPQANPLHAVKGGDRTVASGATGATGAIGATGAMGTRTNAGVTSPTATAAGSAGTPPNGTLSPTGSAAAKAMGNQLAAEITAQGFKGNVFRELAKKLNALVTPPAPSEAAEAIITAVGTWSHATLACGGAQWVDGVLVVPQGNESLRGYVMGIKPNGKVIMGRAEIQRTGFVPPFTRVHGAVEWDSE